MVGDVYHQFVSANAVLAADSTITLRQTGYSFLFIDKAIYAELRDNIWNMKHIFIVRQIFEDIG
jgi:hypothetical protein